MSGSKDDELYTRWIQYGLYSPIMRLHSTSNEFMGKEPWKHSYEAETIAVDVLRQRHAMIPYLYSMNYRTHKHALALVEPMYYPYPDSAEAYEVPNQYFFGSELMVAPITKKRNPNTNLAEIEVWLPKGRWTDIYTGAIYEGDKKIKMYRGLESIPVLAKEGAIIPLATNDRSNDWSNPKDMTVRIYRGTNTFELYEDDGESNEFKNGNYAITRFRVREAVRDVIFEIKPAEGNCSTLPTRRNYTLVFEDITAADSISVTSKGKDVKFDVAYKCGKTIIALKGITPKQGVEIALTGITARANRDKKEQIIDLVTKYQLNVNMKLLKFNSFVKDIYGKSLPDCEDYFKGPIAEVMEQK